MLQQNTKLQPTWALKWAFIFTSIQILIGLVLAPHTPDLKSKYLRLNQWDSAHYAEIIDHHYHVAQGKPLAGEDVHNFKTNVAFFPGYPVMAGILQKDFSLLHTL